MALIESKIAVVDDEEDIVEVVGAILADEFPTIKRFLFTDPMAALDAIRKERINIVVLDLSMPKIHGTDLFHLCLKMAHGCRVILFSGAHSASQVVSAFSDGAQDFVFKPFSREEVISAVRHSVSDINRWNETIGRSVQLNRGSD